MRITAVVGTRPQLIKLAALAPQLTAPIKPFVIDTSHLCQSGLTNKVAWLRQ